MTREEWGALGRTLTCVDCGTERENFLMDGCGDCCKPLCPGCIGEHLCSSWWSLMFDVFNQIARAVVPATEAA